jgi:hypothetical protein
MTQAPIADRLWSLLYGTWGSPRRASRMTSRRDHDRKYIDLPEYYSFTRDHLAEHLAGTATYATTLGAADAAWSGCKDYDSASEAEILAALEQARQQGITAAAIVMPGTAGEHCGGHLWTFYGCPYPVADIRAQLRTIRRTGKGEDYPSGNPIRPPFGYHQIKKTRGTLILQDRRRFDLDDSTQLTAAIEALLALPRNGKPEPGKLSDARTTGAAWGDAYNVENWQDLPDGGPIWRSAYITAAAQRRPDLAKLLRGERVTLVKKDDTRDDSDSAQVAALAYNLLSADVCKPQARAIADYLYPQLRPGKTREHYRAHFDAELERYTPKHYRPQTIRCLGPANGDAPQVLPPAEHKPISRARKDRPQKVAGAAGYLEWLRTQVDEQSGSVMLSQSQCAARLGCCVRTIKRYEKALGSQIERRIFAQRQAGCLFILAPDVVTTSAEDVVITDAETAQQHAENAQPATMQVEHTAAHVPDAPVARPRRAAIVAEAFDALDGCKRVTEKRIRQYIEMNYPEVTISPATMRLMVANERARRRYAQRDAKEAAKARAMRWTSLLKKSQALAGQAAQMRRTGDKRAPIWERMAGIYAAEETRRIESGEIPARLLHGRGVTADEHLILLEIDEQRRVKPAQQGDTSAACVPPQPTPEIEQPDLFNSVRPREDHTLLANLYARIGRHDDAALYRAGGAYAN